MLCLTKRCGEGQSVREIARVLSRSVKTVESHRQHIREKLQLPSANHLLRYAAQRVIEGA